MKIFKIMIPFLICASLSCSVRVKPTPVTTRLTEKVPVIFAIDLSQVPETKNINGSACVWIFNFASDAYTVHLRDAFQAGAEYSFVDFAERVETVTGSSSKKYDIIYQPVFKEFEVSAFMKTRICVMVKIADLRGNILIEKEITGTSQNNGSACITGFLGNIILQSIALEMSVKSAMENYYEQLYSEMLNNPQLDKFRKKKADDQQGSKKEKSVTILLKDGSELVGTIVSQDENTVIIKTTYTTIKISKDKIEIINYKENE